VPFRFLARTCRDRSLDLLCDREQLRRADLGVLMGFPPRHDELAPYDVLDVGLLVQLIQIVRKPPIPAWVRMPPMTWDQVTTEPSAAPDQGFIPSLTHAR